MDIDTSLTAQRFAAQRLGDRRLATPREVVAWLGAVQAQDYLASKWAVGVRQADGTAVDADIEGALDEGSIVRTHAFRATWQLVAPEDVRWMLAVVRPRLMARLAPRHGRLGLDEPTLRKSRTTLEKALRDGREHTRDEIATVLDRVGIEASGQRLAHLLIDAELHGLVCNGARRGKQPTYALLDARIPRPRTSLTREEGLAALTLRYFRSRGPATLADFVWWSGLTTADARVGLDSIRSSLVSEEVDGRTYWRTGGERAEAAASTVRLLPAFDEYLVAYRDRTAALGPDHAKRVNAGGGMLAPCVVLDGRIVGTWHRVLSRSKVTIETSLFDTRHGRRERDALSAAARSYGAFLGLEAELTSVAAK